MDLTLTKDKAVLEKTAFLKTIMIIASSDGILSEDEMQLFYQKGKEFKMLPEELDSIRNSISDDVDSFEQLEDTCTQIVSVPTKLKLIWQLLELCYADGEYSEQESAGLRAVCALLDLNISELEKIEKAYLIQHKSKAKILSGADRLLSFGKNAGKAVGNTVASGTAKASHAIAQGMTSIGSRLSVTLESVKKVKEENKQLRERLKEDSISEAVKQKVVQKLGNKIHLLSMQLSEERKRNEQNEELIAMLQMQIDDLKMTLETAESVQTTDQE